MNIDLKYYVSVFLRRSPYFIIVVALLSSVGFVFAVILPSEYRTQAELLLEPEQIPENLASSTVRMQAAQRVRVIEQRLLTRANLLDLANRLNLYPPGSEMSASARVQDIRSRTNFQIRGGGSNGATFITVSVRGTDPQEITELANEFVTLVMQEDASVRTNQAANTEEFFQNQATELSAQIDERSSQLLEFQSRVGLALPGNLEFLRGRMNDLQTRIADRNEQIASLREQKERLTDVYDRTGSISGESTEQLTALEQQLRSARDQLANARVVYAEQNPKLRFLVNKVAQLEQRVAQQNNSATAQSEEADASSAAERMFNAQIGEIDTQIQAFQQDIQAFESQIAETEAAIQAAPENGVQQSQMERELTQLNQRYNEATNRLAAAQTGQRIERLQQGQRISVLEQATVPSSPYSPDRPKIAMAGIGAGIAGGAGLIVLLEFLNRSIRRPVELSSRLGITPIAVLPYIRTGREVAFKRIVILGIVLLLLIVLPAVVFMVNTYVIPLDQMLEPYFNRLGISIA